MKHELIKSSCSFFTKVKLPFEFDLLGLPFVLSILMIMKQSNSECEWYNSNSCCDSSEAADAASFFDSYGCQQLSTDCQQLVNLVTCGYFCSPQISSAHTSSGKYRICSSFADHVYSSCSKDYFPSSLEPRAT